MWRISIRSVKNFIGAMLLVALCVPGRLRYERSAFHFGGGELALVPYYIPLLLWVALSVITKRGHFIKFDGPLRVVLLFIAVNIFLIPAAEYPVWAFLEVVRICTCVGIFVLMADILRPTESVNVLGAGIGIIITLQVISAALQSVTGITVSGLDLNATQLNAVSGDSYRLVGTLGHPGTLAQFLTALLPLMIFCAFKTRRKWLISALIAVPVLVIFTQSRTGIVTLIFVIVSALAGYLISRKRFENKVMLLVASLGATLIAIVLLWTTITARFLQDPEESTTIRRLLVEVAGNMIYQHPIAGVGLNNFTEVMRSYDQSGITYSFPYPVHNIYLLITAETGLVGLAAFLLMNIYFVRVAVRNMRRSQTGVFDSLSFFCLISLFAIYMTGMLGWAWRQDSIQGVYWLCLAAVTAESRLPTLLRPTAGRRFEILS